VNPTAGATGAHEDRMWKRPGASTKARHIPFLAQGEQRGDAVDNFYARPKRAIHSPTVRHFVGNPDAALAATIHTPKAISPTETKYERAVSMASRLRFFCDLVDG
jgi:hypothetical protein